VTVFHEAGRPSCLPGAELSESIPAVCSMEKRLRAGKTFGTGVEMAGFGRRETGEEIWWTEWYEP